VNPTIDTQTLTDDSADTTRPEVEQPQLVLIMERSRPLAGGARHSLANIDRVTIGRARERTVQRIVEKGQRILALGIPDPRLSSSHARLEHEGASWSFFDCDSTNGSRIQRKAVRRAVLDDGDVLELASTFFRFRAAVRTRVSAPSDIDFDQLLGLAGVMATAVPELVMSLEQMASVARSDVSVLLTGPSGSGKEVLARAIHDESRRGAPFVPVNCGALPGPLVESLLFGHKKGAFSGATGDEIGLVRAAHGGTLFLDEIADLPGPSQAALLRVLQEREVFPVGATRALTVDVRVVAATHRPIGLLAARGDFRNDLLARVAAFTCELPSLHDRIDDIGHLVARILGQDRPAANSLAFSSNAIHTLLGHPWRNNVRELVQSIAVSKTLAVGNRIEKLQLPTSGDAVSNPDPPRPVLSPELEDLRARMIVMLTENQGNVTRVAESMGKARNQVHRWLKRFGLNPADFRK
jgi:DNA-binding NtrC family response regulator